MQNALTVDVENWYDASLLSPYVSAGYRDDRVAAATREVMALLEEYRARATFFVLGKVAEEHPALVEEIAGRGHEVVLLHMLTPPELNPSLRGDLRLSDSESKHKREVSVDGPALAAYQRRLAVWQAELRGLAGKHNGRYALIRTGAPLRQILLQELRHANVLR